MCTCTCVHTLSPLTAVQLCVGESKQEVMGEDKNKREQAQKENESKNHEITSCADPFSNHEMTPCADRYSCITIFDHVSDAVSGK